MWTVTFQAVFSLHPCCELLTSLQATRSLQNVASFFAGGGVREAGGRAYWVWGNGEGWAFAWNIYMTRPTVLTEAERIHYTKLYAAAALGTRH
jgi:hypothetical protein